MEKRSRSKSSASKSEKGSAVKNGKLGESWEADLKQNSSQKERNSSRKNSPKPQSATKKSLEKSAQKNSKQNTPKSSNKKIQKVLEEEVEENNNLEIEENELNNVDDFVAEEVNEIGQEEEEFHGNIEEEKENSDDENLLGDMNEDDLEGDNEENYEGLDEEEIKKRKEENIKKALEFRESQNKKGVVYLSSIPPYMKVSQLRKFFGAYDVERIYLNPEDEGKRKFRIKTGGNKRRKYTEGWMEFKDKKIAKYVAMVFNNQKIGGKRRSFYTEDALNLKYLPKFKWENLTEKINYDLRMRKEKMRNELALAKKQHDFYLEQVEKGKKIMGIKKHKDLKRAALDDIEDVLHKSVAEGEDEEQGTMKVSFDEEKDRIRRIFKQKKPKMN